MSDLRIGLGIDFHRFAADRTLVLGGVTIPHDCGLLGHSDADVLTHAICDGLLGAAGLGDIGAQFPDTDERYRGISSLRLLEEVIGKLRGRGLRPIHVDATVIAETPKLFPHVPAIRAALSEVLEIAPDRIGLKATTSERMGALGREEGMGAMAVCLIGTDEQYPYT